MNDWMPTIFSIFGAVIGLLAGMLILALREVKKRGDLLAAVIKTQKGE